MDNVHITIVRPGKQPTTVTVASGSSVENALQEAGISRADYQDWSITGQNGSQLGLSDSLTTSVTLIAGSRMSGADAR